MDHHRTIFIAACEIGDATLRTAYLDEACAGNAELRQKVEALLADRSAADTYFAEIDGRDLRPATLPRPESVGPYRILETLGHGGMGDVYRAEQRTPVRREVALKLIRPGMDSRQVITRFEAERQALALMDHPNIARVYDAGADEHGRPYFAMEYVKGVPITEYADAHRLTVKDRLELFRQVCQAIQHAHQKGVIHRDIKPGNVLVSTQDGRPFAKVIDFGIAKATAQQLTDKTLFTLHDQFIGTPQYMSPEQASGSLDIDTRSDVYSLGVLLYELLTGRPPFDTEKLKRAALHEIVRILREEEPPAPSTRLHTLGGLPTAPAELRALAESRSVDPRELVRQVRGELDWLVMKAMEKDRARRYASPGELAEDVEGYLSGGVLKAAPPTLRYRAGKFIRAHRTGVIFGAAALGLLLLAITGTSVGLLREREARAEAVHHADEAGRARMTADESRKTAEARAAQLERAAYKSTLQVAAGAVESGDTNVALEALESCPEHLREWEWRWLMAMADSTLYSHPYPAGSRCISSSPDGAHAVLWSDADEKREVLLWDACEGRTLATVRAPGGGRILTASVSNRGKRVALLEEGPEERESERTGSVHVWDRATGAFVWNLQSSPDFRIISGTGTYGNMGLLLDGNATKVLVQGLVLDESAVKPRQESEVHTRIYSLTKEQVVDLEGVPVCYAPSFSGSGEFLVGWCSGPCPHESWGVWSLESGRFFINGFGLEGAGAEEIISSADLIKETGLHGKDVGVLSLPSGRRSMLFSEDSYNNSAFYLAGFAAASRMLVTYSSSRIYLSAVDPDAGLEEDDLPDFPGENSVRLSGVRGKIGRVAVNEELGLIFAYSSTHVSVFPLLARSDVNVLSSLHGEGWIGGDIECGNDLLIEKPLFWSIVAPDTGAAIEVIPRPALEGDVQFISRSGPWIVAGTSEKLMVRDAGQPGKALYELSRKHPTEKFQDACIDPSGRFLALQSAGSDSRMSGIVLTRLDADRPLGEVTRGGVLRLVGASRTLLFLTDDDRFKAFGIEDLKGRETAALAGHSEFILDNEGKFLASVRGNRVFLHDADDLTPLRQWALPLEEVLSLSWADGAAKLIAVGEDRVLVCDAERGEVLFATMRPGAGRTSYATWGSSNPPTPHRQGRWGEFYGALGNGDTPAAVWIDKPLRERWKGMVAAKGGISDRQLADWADRCVEEFLATDKPWGEAWRMPSVQGKSATHLMAFGDALAKRYYEFDNQCVDKARELLKWKGDGDGPSGEKHPDRPRSLLARIYLQGHAGKVNPRELKQVYHVIDPGGIVSGDDPFANPSSKPGLDPIWDRLWKPETGEEARAGIERILSATEADAAHLRREPDIETQAVIGAACYRLGDYEKARRVLREIPWVSDPDLVRNWPLFTGITAFLSMAEHRLGNRDAGLRELHRCLHYWRSQTEFHDPLQREAAALAGMNPASIESPVVEPEARRIAAEALSRKMGSEVKVEGTIVRVSPGASGHSAFLYLDSLEREKGLMASVNLFPGDRMSELLALEGRRVELSGRVGLHTGEIWHGYGRLNVEIPSASAIRSLEP